MKKTVRLYKLNPFNYKRIAVYPDDFKVVSSNELDTYFLKKRIEALKEFIMLGGKIQPIIVIRVNENHYKIIDGFCRFWAYKQLDKEEIEVMCQGDL